LHFAVIPTLNFFICILMSLLLTYCKDIISYLTHLQIEIEIAMKGIVF